MTTGVDETVTDPAGMRFSVDAWDPTYGSNLELPDELGASSASVVVDVEMPADRWRPIDADPQSPAPGAVLFIDGVRRIDARVWIDDRSVVDGVAAGEASMGVCASYAAGVVCCCAAGAHVAAIRSARGLFTVAPHATDVATAAGIYQVSRTAAGTDLAAATALSAALQRRLGELEVTTAGAARAALADHAAGDDDLLVIDGPLRGRTHLPRAVGYIKSHRSAYLPPPLHAIVGTLAAGQRTPVFLMGSSWDRHAWYLRLPCRPGAPWAGIARVECSADLSSAEVVHLANQSVDTLCRYASSEYKEPRAPQNLYPIAGLEKQLRRRLGDPHLLCRMLRQASRARRPA